MDAASDALDTPIRVLLADLPTSLSDELVTLIGYEPDLQLIGQVAGRLNLLLAAAMADVVISASPVADHLPGIGTHLLSEYPSLKLLVLAEDGSGITVFWRGLRRRRLGSVAPSRLSGWIRQLYRRDEL
ncbi:MAG: hypothetical protein AB4911_06200 [Oscillochloridaceae bacterium umkhey_bin13]